MKRYLIFLALLMLWIIPQQLYSQENGYAELRKELNNMFSGINKEKVPTGLLRDYAIEYENLDYFDSSSGLTDNNIVDVFTFGKILKTIKSSSLKGNPISSFEKKVSQLSKKSTNGREVKIAVALYQYAQIKGNALKENHMNYKKGRVTSLSPEALQMRTMCAGCVLDNQKKTNDITFSVTKEYMLSNIGIKGVEVDYGTGYKDILNNSITAHLQNGKHAIKIKVTDENNHVYLSHSLLTILEPENHITTRSTASTISTTITGQAYNGVVTSADVTWIKPSTNYSDKIKNPFIFVEGFDPRDLKPEEQGSMNYRNVLQKLSEMPNLPFLKDMDIIYVDWCDAGEYIQANANTLIAVLNWVNSQLDNNPSSTILLGYSMGGIVARYALKTMENANIAHHVGTYISCDSPHLGANVPLGILYGYHGIMQLFKEKDILSSLANKFVGLDKMIELGNRYAYSTATQQMLVNYVDPAGHLNNSEHILWQKELKQLGFPQGDKGKFF